MKHASSTFVRSQGWVGGATAALRKTEVKPNHATGGIRTTRARHERQSATPAQRWRACLSWGATGSQSVPHGVFSGGRAQSFYGWNPYNKSAPCRPLRHLRSGGAMARNGARRVVSDINKKRAIEYNRSFMLRMKIIANALANLSTFHNQAVQELKPLKPINIPLRKDNNNFRKEVSLYPHLLVSALLSA